MLQGPNKYAYAKGRRNQDTLTVNVCNWILSMEQGHMIGLYCSNVSGAFDRVDRERLCEKLPVSGLHPTVIAFLISWSEDRLCRVVLGGVNSPDEPWRNSVFQGTVFGPPLWNIFMQMRDTQSMPKVSWRQCSPMISTAGDSSASGATKSTECSQQLGWS